MYQSAETITEQLQKSWEREFAAAALETLADQAMAESSPALDRFHVTRRDLRAALIAVFKAHLSNEMAIEWAAKISEDVMSFEQYQTMHIGD